jgi:antitoxin PrlF
MSIATLTAKGQTTIPKPVRTHLGLQSGDKLDFVIESDGCVTLRPHRIEPLQLSGLLAKRYQGPPIAAEDMDAGIAEQVVRENP